MQAHLRLPALRFDEQAAWVRRLVLALGQQRTGNEAHYFIELDAWHVHRLKVLRAVFPETPFLFLFRDPEQVMLSHSAGPAMLSLPGAMPDPRVLGLELADVVRLNRHSWCAAVLERICESALARRRDPKMLFVDHSDLPGAVYGPIARHFGLELDSNALARMRARTRFDSKLARYWPGSDAPPPDPRQAARVRELCAGRLAELYAALRQASQPQSI